MRKINRLNYSLTKVSKHSHLTTKTLPFEQKVAFLNVRKIND